MARRRQQGDRKNLNRTSRKAKDAQLTKWDTLFGHVPVIEREMTGPAGQKYYMRVCDPDYQPKLPAGAVRGDVQKQDYCPHCCAPRYYYVDEEKICVQCEGRFSFSAKEQKYWYETLGFYLGSTAIRCPRCRRNRRTQTALGRQIGQARSALKSNPNDAEAALSLAEAVVRLRQVSGKGDVDEAITAARRSVKLWPARSEGLFWEGLCQHEAGRPEKARETLESFLRTPPRSSRQRKLRMEAEALLAASCQLENP